MSMPDQLAWNQKVMRHKAELKKAAAAKKAEEEAKTAMPEPAAANEEENTSRKSSDSFGTDASMIDESRVEEPKGYDETKRMTVIPEEVDDESSRMSEVPS